MQTNNGNPVSTVIPVGEPYQNLIAQEYGYQIYSVSQKASTSTPEAILEMDMKSRLIPIFQFIAFFNGDLEILPSPTMNLNGPVHSNGDLYLASDNGLSITGQVTAVRNFYNKRKDDNSFKNGAVQIANASNNLENLLDANNGVQTTSPLPPQKLSQYWGTQISLGPTTAASLPSTGLLDITGDYYKKADLQIKYQPSAPIPFAVTAIDRSSSPSTSVNLSQAQLLSLMQPVTAVGTAFCPLAPLPGCVFPAPVQNVLNSFFNNRENQNINLLQLNILALTVWNKINGGVLFKTASADLSAPVGSFQQLGLAAADISEGGIVIHATIDSSAYPLAATTTSPYGFAITQGSQLFGLSKYPTAPLSFSPTGVSIVSDQAIYLQGDYNTQSQQGAALMADSLNVLSNSCHTSNYVINCGIQNQQNSATPTTISAAFLSGTDNTTPNTSQNFYSGGLENYPRFHENWQPGGVKQTLKYRGSFVSIGVPQHVSGRWKSQLYTPPGRDWNYNSNFNIAANLPPLTPRFVYLKQEQFLRTFN